MSTINPSTASNLAFTDGSQPLGTKAGTDGHVLTWDTGTGTWRAEAAAAAGVGGSTGATDNRVLRADGTGGATVQNSAVAIDDSGNITGAGTIDVGAADTTLSRTGAGDIAIEGNAVYRAGGTKVAIGDGGTGVGTAAGALVALGAAGRPVALSTLTAVHAVTNAIDLTSSFVIADDGTGNNSILAYDVVGTQLTVQLVMNWSANTNNHQAGISMRDSSGKYVTFFVYMNGSGTLSFTTAKWTNYTTFSANYTSTAIAASINTRLAAQIAASVPFWMRITVAAGSWIASWSLNGANWTQFDTRTVTDFLSAIDNIGIAVNPGAISQPLSLEVLAWSAS